jgi:hypothetical protein
MPFAESEPLGLAGQLTSQLRVLLATSGLRPPSSSSEESKEGYRMLGTLHNETNVSGSYGNVQAYNLSIRAEIKLIDKSNAIIWQNSFTEEQEFLPINGEDIQPILTETNRVIATSILMDKLALRIVDGLLQWQDQKRF